MRALLVTVPFILVLFFATCGQGGNVLTGSLPGGISEDRPVTPDVKKLIRGIHPQIKSHLEGVPGGANVIGRIKPISFRTQLVNGVNYFVKVRARTPNKNVFYHLRIFKGFDDQPAQLMKVEGPKRKRDEITFF